MATFRFQETEIAPGFVKPQPFQHFAAGTFPYIHPIPWLYSHFAVGGWSPLQRLSGMLTAHMTHIEPQNGFTWHPHRGVEIYTWVLEGTLYHEDSTGGRGTIQAGELQRMFAGDYIEHQELNLTDDPVRVIQIWFVADRHHQGLPPHYQQVGRAGLPLRRIGDADVYALIGQQSPMEQHMTGRLTATTVKVGGTTQVELPLSGEDLFLYVTDGAGTVSYDGNDNTLGQYDVLLARPDANMINISAGDAADLHYLNFYLPRFLS